MRMVARPRLAAGAAAVAVGVAAAVSGCTGAGERPPTGAASANPSTSPAASSGAASASPSASPAVSSGAASAPPQTSASSPSAVVTGEGCNGTQVLLGNGFPEVRGTAEGAELWGLLFTKGPPPLPRGEEVKIVWRMTGEGPLQIRATLPDGTRAKLAWGPEEHGGSSWRRPGQEWGTGFVFPERGCWKVELTRTRSSGHVWLPVR
ncbi:hypothetical protein [Nonomuraea sp. SYSU D8015]|uniref:hypothetical protein n=1 Tax=Nonomuraea sp. SYSU D8015 TaxID=2593644 RepID=UPI001660C572|nr:hypothetical protein [Nonomuraea sp. SYSU D8015]